jgi:transcriptional regulator of acetoin/glycerol metabolism
MLARLEAHDWPGNVRELANVLETALILGDGALVLPEGFTRRAERPRFESAIRETIERALRATRGKLYGPGGAAALLGLEPSTLQSKMKKLGIARTDFV